MYKNKLLINENSSQKKQEVIDFIFEETDFFSGFMSDRRKINLFLIGLRELFFFFSGSSSLEEIIEYYFDFENVENIDFLTGNNFGETIAIEAEKKIILENISEKELGLQKNYLEKGIFSWQPTNNPPVGDNAAYVSCGGPTYWELRETFSKLEDEDFFECDSQIYEYEEALEKTKQAIKDKILPLFFKAEIKNSEERITDEFKRILLSEIESVFKQNFNKEQGKKIFNKIVSLVPELSFFKIKQWTQHWFDNRLGPSYFLFHYEQRVTSFANRLSELTFETNFVNKQKKEDFKLFIKLIFGFLMKMGVGESDEERRELIQSLRQGNTSPFLRNF